MQFFIHILRLLLFLPGFLCFLVLGADSIRTSYIYRSQGRGGIHFASEKKIKPTPRWDRLVKISWIGFAIWGVLLFSGLLEKADQYLLNLR